MSDEIYHKLAKLLDTLPNGFPATPNGVEIKLLKKIFTPEEADLFMDLRLTAETPKQIAERTGRPLKGLDEQLVSMWKRGELFGVDLNGFKMFKMIPWVLGIYEFQLKRMDREFAELCEEYAPFMAKQFFTEKPQFMQTIPIEQEISEKHETLSYEKVSTIIENGLSFAVADCICKKEKSLLDERCDKPMEVCLAIAPIPGAFDNFAHWGRPISKQEAYDVLKTSEEAGLVHLTQNIESEHFFICNCCGCCCGILRGMNEYGFTDAINSNFCAKIDPDTCISCGVCEEERCQVKAIEEVDEVFRVIEERCIGCGLCISTCPSESIQLVRKDAQDITKPPKNEMDWLKVRGGNRGVDFSDYI
ncbi:MAG: 4Fe-4S binding protein [Desulfobacteraceae bacterium]|nr:4Fe-4S binding protein [Desulfobacteraceae bacterium]MBC2756364.1 4Fe-4S binding protein [Desulfobacteraceae bacterium]